VTLRGLVVIRKILSFRTGGFGPEESAGVGSAVGGAGGGQQIPPFSLCSSVGMTSVLREAIELRNDKEDGDGSGADVLRLHHG
jgi:hypothetical protein